MGEHLLRRRLDLGLRQRDVARALGVTEASVCHWEKGRTVPALRFVPRIVSFLGYAPDDSPPQGLGQRIVTKRRLMGLSQKALARRLRIDPTTLARWERGEGRPSRKLVGRIHAFLDGQAHGTEIEGEPIFVRALSPKEHRALMEGLRSRSFAIVRRCRILLLSAQGQTPLQIASELHCSQGTVRRVVRAFGGEGLDCLRARPHGRESPFDAAGRQRLRQLLHISPRQHAYDTNVWTLALLAEACTRERIASRPVSGWSVARVLRQMGVDWKRARWVLTRGIATAPTAADPTHPQ